MRSELPGDAAAMKQVGEMVVKVFRRGQAVAIGPKMVKEELLDKHPSVVHEKAMKGDVKVHGIS
jgi:hypothetical protein